MTPKDKAILICYNFYHRLEHTFSEDYSPHAKEICKECALISVNEIIETLNSDIKDLDVRGNVLIDLIKYWREVREEIRKL